MKKNNTDKRPKTKTVDSKDIDKELKDLIDKHENFKKGISKIFSEIEKKISDTNESNK